MLRKSFVRPCAQCNADIIAPTWSEYLSTGCVRNVWSCDDCGYEFEDTVFVLAPRLEPKLKQHEQLLARAPGQRKHKRSGRRA